MLRTTVTRYTRGYAASTARRFYATARTEPCKTYLEPTHVASKPSAKTQAFLDRGSTYLLPVYARPDFIVEKGKGSWVWDVDGKKYLDFTAGIAVNSLGHADEGVTKVLAEQAGKLLHASNVYHNEWAGKLAELLVTLTQKEGGLGFSPSSSSDNVNGDQVPKVFFANSGTEANEGALKVARKFGKEGGVDGKSQIVCFENGFHGRSMGALSVTPNPKYQAPFAPLIPGVAVGKVNQFEGLDSLVNQDTCAVIVEPVQGEGGINAASLEWLRALRKRCNEVGAVLIFDEIQCGLYRSGTLWAHSEYPVDCHPDIVTMAKPLANGYPIGAVLIRPEIAKTMGAGTHGTTFGGSPLACAVGYHVLSRLSEPAMKSHVLETSAYLRGRLEQLPKWFPELLQENVRGRGLILGIGFKDTEVPGKVVQLARERGVFMLTAGKDAIRFVPSLNVSKDEVDFAVDVLESSLSRV
ncbi:acetylornithine aminotransferase [Coprinopsis cinerea okayama7|uniref:acetylornithine transaminase n=1 Tax=Coprinopsis cinerea (strain Okayama-7 / 130 / ATCC MYA-4618 / FGSC 9003) TaxID=240176 RepID=D6RMU4_COPC7|nr:acetylornithine aminotransferase [Coprinopsis cinerea okayama7\|eukprot:XP_002911149.1 acetylornithine aminotransferase [Coprinopsis cinerea okayama7\